MRLAKENLTHEKIKDSIIELGRILGLIGEEEYRIDDSCIDVVWKQRQDADHSHAFEVVATKSNNSINRALINLSNAIRSWKGVRLFIVTPEEIKQKIEKRASSKSFSDIKEVLQILTPEDTTELFNKFEVLIWTPIILQCFVKILTNRFAIGAAGCSFYEWLIPF